jgi:hypothetical protein
MWETSPQRKNPSMEPPARLRLAATRAAAVAGGRQGAGSKVPYARGVRCGAAPS